MCGGSPLTPHEFVESPHYPERCDLCGQARDNTDFHFSVDAKYRYEPHAPVMNKRLGVCQTCGRAANDSIHHYEKHFFTAITSTPDRCMHCYMTLKHPIHVDDELRPGHNTVEIVTFASGATSGGALPPYFLMTDEGHDAVALRFGHGNKKHEKETNVLSEANWLKAFHARDLAFFRDRGAHAIKHIRREMSGHYDKDPGGNAGAVGWWANVMPFVAKWDPPFYAAVTGVAKHPGAHDNRHHCPCPRCGAQIRYDESMAKGKP